MQIDIEPKKKSPLTFLWIFFPILILGLTLYFIFQEPVVDNFEFSSEEITRKEIADMQEGMKMIDGSFFKSLNPVVSVKMSVPPKGKIGKKNPFKK